MIEDPYAGLRDLKARDTRDYIDAENEYCSAFGRRFEPLRDKLFDELRSRMAEDDCSVAERVDAFYYYTRNRAGYEYEIHCRRRVGSEREAVVLDENLLAAGHEYFELGAFSVCPRHRLVAYTIDVIGDESYQLCIRDIETGELVDGPIYGVSDDVCWCEDATAVFYARVDATSRPSAVYSHILGTVPADDRMVLEEPDPAYFLSLWKSRTKRYIFIESNSNASSEVYYVDAGGTGDVPHCFRRRERGVEYSIDHRPGEFLILTNKGAPDFRLLTTPENDVNISAWREIIPERAGITLDFVEPYSSHIVIGERQAGIPVLRVMDTAAGSIRTLEFPDPAYELDLEDLEDFQSPEIWVEYSAPTTPDTIYAYPLSGGERRVLKTQEPEGYNREEYETTRLGVPVRGGVTVPLTMIRKKTTTQPAPLLLTGYGAYEENYELYFDCDLLSMLDRGVIVAIAHVRGGGELGRSWYQDGKLLNKENSFDDFVACADFLVASGYTCAGQIALHGSSAGGLLVAVAMQRRPGLFASVVAEVPFVDVINTLLDDDAPLTQYDREEFGDPNDVLTFEYIKKYSPYDNVRTGAYPPLLVTAALEDQRVGAWEPLKWVAKMRRAKTDQNPLLLKVETAGHYGLSGRYQELKHSAFIYAFMLDCWGMTR